MSDVTSMPDGPETLSGSRRWRRRERGGVQLDRGRSLWRTLSDPSSTVPTYVGVLVALVGFALIAVAWAEVAGLTDVWKQMPYVMSAGLPGLGLVMTGLVIVNISARRQDAAARARQAEMLAEALRDLQRSLEQ
jgi:hypothetical protein